MPAPLSGSIFVRNGKRRGTKRNSRRNGLAFRANRGARRSKRNGLAFRANRGARRNSRRGKRNGLSFRANRSFGKRRSNRRSKRNGLAFRANRGARRNSRRNGYFGKMLSKAKSAVFGKSRRGKSRKSAKRNGYRRMKRNGLGQFVGKARSTAMRIPGFKLLSPAIGGALVLLPVHYALQRYGNYLPTMTRPAAYTLSGLAVGIAVGLLGTVSKTAKKHRKYIAGTAIVIGGAIDAMRYLRGTSYDLSGYGDGFAWEVVPYSGSDAGSDLGDLYSGAALADAYYSDGDMSGLEVQTALSGAWAWKRTFQAPQQHHRTIAPGQPSPNANKEGHRFGWLIKLIGFEEFRKVAALPPQDRQTLLNKIRAQALVTVQAQTANASQTRVLTSDAPEMAGFGGHASQYSGVLHTGAAF